MDSGSFENEQVSIQEMNEAATLLKADEVVLPDAPGDFKQTLKRSWRALGKVASSRVMFVPQGRTHREWCDCLHSWLNQWSKRAWDETYDLSIGVASLREPNSNKSVTGTKAALLEEVLDLDYSAHLLGLPHLGNHVRDILSRAHTTGVRGIDTSTAFALGARGTLVTPRAEKIRLGDPDQYERLSTKARRLIQLNINILNYWTEVGAGNAAIPTFLIRQTASKWAKYWAEGFIGIEQVMKSCGMPAGRYALLKERRREKYVRPLTRGQKPVKGETLVRIS